MEVTCRSKGKRRSPIPITDPNAEPAILAMTTRSRIFSPAKKPRPDNIDEFNRITGWVANHNGQIINLRTVETSLEDIFLKLMN